VRQPTLATARRARSQVRRRLVSGCGGRPEPSPQVLHIPARYSTIGRSSAGATVCTVASELARQPISVTGRMRWMIHWPPSTSAPVEQRPRLQLVLLIAVRCLTTTTSSVGVRTTLANSGTATPSIAEINPARWVRLCRQFRFRRGGVHAPLRLVRTTRVRFWTTPR